MLTLGLTSLTSLALILLLLLRILAAGRAVSADPASPIVGHHAPDFAIQTWTWDGSASQTVRLAAYKGHPILINFWASWCEACKEEEPVLEAAWEKYRPQGVAFIGVAFQDHEKEGTAFLRQYHVTFPSGPDPSGTSAINYALTGTPETVFINHQGVVVKKIIGAIDDGTLDRSIQAILA